MPCFIIEDLSQLFQLLFENRMFRSFLRKSFSLICQLFCLPSQQGKSESITVVKLLSCFDDLVAIGTASGRVAIFQLVSSLPGRNKQVNVKFG